MYKFAEAKFTQIYMRKRLSDKPQGRAQLYSNWEWRKNDHTSARLYTSNHMHRTIMCIWTSAKASSTTATSTPALINTVVMTTTGTAPRHEPHRQIDMRRGSWLDDVTPRVVSGENTCIQYVLGYTMANVDGQVRDQRKHMIQSRTAQQIKSHT